MVQSDDAVAQLLRKSQSSGDIVRGQPRHVEVIEAIAVDCHRRYLQGMAVLATLLNTDRKSC